MAAIRLCRAALPGMKQRKWGRIINVLNIGAKVPRAQGSPTVVSRAAGLALTPAQVDEIVRGDIELRCGHDPIHDTRVAIRRLRSTIRVFDELVDVFAEDDVADVEADLKWFAGVLGEVRDCQVQQDGGAPLPVQLFQHEGADNFWLDRRGRSEVILAASRGSEIQVACHHAVYPSTTYQFAMNFSHFSQAMAKVEGREQ